MHSLIIILFVVSQINLNIAREKVDDWIEQALKDTNINLLPNDKRILSTQVKLVINLRRLMNKKYQQELAAKHEKQRNQKLEKEKMIYQKYLLGRIKSSVLRDFHTVRY